ncbi:MAG: sulfurtransferase TusA family protein [Chloroflexi bacterium]|nr:sulfurtransferase TusA family protein [Chloroflexota bacterium]
MNESKTVDARGLSCPEPAMMTREALSRLKGGTVAVLVDSGTSRDNVRRLAERFGWRAAVESQPAGGYRLVLTK